MSVHELFTETARTFGGSIAVEGGRTSLTYAELENRANYLAHAVRASGATQGTPVVILLREVARLIPSIIGVLKAGCVFVPLHPTFPAKRLEAMLAEVAPRAVVTESRFVEKLKRAGLPGESRVILVDGVGAGDAPTDGPELLHADLDNTPHGVEPLRLASEPGGMCYILFTSDSGGRPRGLAGRHAALEHFVRWEIETFRVGLGTRVNQFAAPWLDGFLKDVFVPLCAGGTVCLPDSQDVLLDGARLATWVDAQRINVLHITPPLLRSMLRTELGPGCLSSLQYALVAGPGLIPSDVKRWTEVFGQRARLVRLYGAPETTISKFVYEVRPSDAESRAVPIGRPMPGAAALVLDDGGRVCAPGSVGEIYIRTPHRALGYHNRPGQTQEVFVPNPVGNDPRSVVFKSGDLGRLLPGGDFELVGRRDRRVKVRGAHIDLDEVEDALRASAAVKDTAVVARDDGGEQYLCAFIVPARETPLGEYRGHLFRSLPGHTAPTRFALLRALPLALDGGIDRHALLQLPTVEPAAGEYVAPRSPVEEVLASIWAEVLKVERVGVHDNFFDLGGHSLPASQIIARVRAELQVEVPLRSIFEEATVAGMAKAIEKEMGRAGQTEAVPLRRIPRDAALPLSSGQQRLWFLQQLEPENTSYNVTHAVRLEGALDVRAIEKCLNEIVSRHEVLRTSFRMVEGLPVQQIHDSCEVELQLVDLRGTAAGEHDEMLRQLLDEQASRPFDLTRAPLLRVSLARLGDETYVLLMVVHHIISDNWSRAVFLHEVGALYAAFARGLGSPLAELPVQYADYAHWQRGWMGGEDFQRQLSFWKLQLAGAPASELSTDRPRPESLSFRGAMYNLELSPELTAKLRELSRRAGVTLFATLLSAFDVLMFRHTGQADICVGSPVANRGRAELEGLIGFFVNTLLLRCDLSGDPTVRELLGRVSRVVVESCEHQAMPFETLVSELRPARDLSRNPLFQIMFMLNDGTATATLPGLRLTDMDVHGGASTFDVTMGFYDMGATLIGRWEYNTDLFDESTIRRAAGHLRVLLEAFAADPDLRLSELPLLTEEEHRQLTVEWNRTAVPFSEDKCLHELFAETVRRTPDAVAVVSEGESLSFDELERRANRLARYLQKLGVGPEARVGVMLERSAEMVAGLLGILKAGGAYVPLDPSYPEERLAFMLEDARPLVVLTQASLRARLPESRATVVCLDTDGALIAGERSDAPPTGVTPRNLAYVIYTSGSTGRPKGVLVQHRSLVNFTEAMAADWQLRPGDRVLQLASVSWDTHAEEVYPCLAAGATLVVGRPSMLDSIPLFLRECRRLRVTFINLPSGYWHQLVADLAAESLTLPETLRLVTIGGERALPEMLRRWHEVAPEGVRLLMNYGATETTAITTQCALERPPEGAAPIWQVPIGGAIQNVRAYVLDASLGCAPLGVAGELFVGGAGLARGYHGRPELTADRFIPDPFSVEPGARLYRTGDLARRLPSGHIEHLGRIDDQVKIRGFRIEVGEVEAALGRHPCVRESAVVAHEFSAGDKRLVAYVVARDGELSAAEVRAFLGERLPDYMTPAAFVMLGSLPRTPSGKIDRRALPPPDGSYPESAKRERVAPRTPTEKALARICAEATGIADVSVTDDFFHLGGNSLLAIKFLARVRQELRVEIPVRGLFQSPTLEGLARLVDTEEQARARRGAEVARTLEMLETLSEDEASAQTRDGVGAFSEAGATPSRSMIEVQKGDARTPFFCVHPISGAAFPYFELARLLGPAQPFYAFQARGLDGDEPPLDRVETMAARYVEELRGACPSGPYLLGGWSFGGVVAFEMARQLEAQGQEVALLALLDSEVPDGRAVDEAEEFERVAALLGVEAARALSRDDLPAEPGQHSQGERVAWALEAARGLGLLPADAGADAFRHLLRVYRTNEEALKTYTPGPFNGRLTLFVAAERRSGDPAPGWEPLAGGGLVRHTVPGNHHTMMRPPNVEALASALKGCFPQTHAGEVDLRLSGDSPTAL